MVHTTRLRLRYHVEQNTLPAPIDMQLITLAPLHTGQLLLPAPVGKHPVASQPGRYRLPTGEAPWQGDTAPALLPLLTTRRKSRSGWALVAAACHEGLLLPQEKHTEPSTVQNWHNGARLPTDERAHTSPSEKTGVEDNVH